MRRIKGSLIAFSGFFDKNDGVGKIGEGGGGINLKRGGYFRTNIGGGVHKIGD